MNKLISIIALGAVISLFFASCDNIIKEEETTDGNEEFIEIVDKSKPLSSGNLITKTNTDENGNINVNYYDNDSKLVEQYVWNEDEKISHILMTYNENSLMATKEEISPDGNSNTVYSYQYDNNDKLNQTSVSSFSDGHLEKTVTYNAENDIIGSTLYTYGENKEVSKIERLDKDESVIDYITYEYSESGLQTKATEYDATGKMREYTLLEYNGTLLSKESRYDSESKLTGYNTYEYHEDGRIKTSKQFDKNNKLLSSSDFE